MPNPVEVRLEVYENMVEVLLVLETFFTVDSEVKGLLCDCTVASISLQRMG